MSYRFTSLPMMEIISKTRNTKKITFAIDAAPAAIPPNPKIAATRATRKNINVNLSMIFIV